MSTDGPTRAACVAAHANNPNRGRYPAPIQRVARSGATTAPGDGSASGRRVVVLS